MPKRSIFTLSLPLAVLAGLPSGAAADRAFVVNSGDDDVTVVDTGTEAVLGSDIPVGETPERIAMHPEGTRAYVTNAEDNTVSVIDTEKEEVEGAPIAVGNSPSGIAITPEDSLAFVSNAGDNTVSVIDIEKEEVDETIESELGESPTGIAITPDGEYAYVANSVSNDVSVIEVEGEVASSGLAVSALGPVASGVVTPSIEVGNTPFDIAFTEVPGPEGGEEEGVSTGFRGSVL